MSRPPSIKHPRVPLLKVLLLLPLLLQLLLLLRLPLPLPLPLLLLLLMLLVVLLLNLELIDEENVWVNEDGSEIYKRYCSLPFKVFSFIIIRVKFIPYTILKKEQFWKALTTTETTMEKYQKSILTGCICQTWSFLT